MNVSVRFYKGTGILSWLVRFITGGKYAHVEIVIEGLGFVCLFRERCHTRWTPTDDSCVSIQTTCSAGFQGRSLEGLGSEYDWIGAIRAGTPFGREHPSKWFCSELAAYVIGLENPHVWSPQDLAKFFGVDK